MMYSCQVVSDTLICSFYYDIDFILINQKSIYFEDICCNPIVNTDVYKPCKEKAVVHFMTLEIGRRKSYVTTITVLN